MRLVDRKEKREWLHRNNESEKERREGEGGKKVRRWVTGMRVRDDGSIKDTEGKMEVV